MKLTFSGGKSIPCSLDIISKASLDKHVKLSDIFLVFHKHGGPQTKLKDSFCPDSSIMATHMVSSFHCAGLGSVATAELFIMHT